ncbi:hypothetical protein MKY20_11530 [Cytobacillus sp. FSL W8-0315]|uniref:hypothetical protein n=1 Tax=Cytobacillus sp. FSL W8-0315 TaxID=2921600 RepID=UPI0030F6CAB5
MARKEIVGITDFSQGINVKDAANLIPKNALTDAQNAVIGRGFISKRPGYERFISAAIERPVNWQDIGGKKWSDL